MSESLAPPLSESIEDRLVHIARDPKLPERMAGKDALTAVRAEVTRGACWSGLSHPLSRLALAVSMEVAHALPQAVEATAQWQATGTGGKGIPPQGRHPEVRTAYSIASRILRTSTIMIVTVPGRQGAGNRDLENQTSVVETVRHRGVRGLRDGEVNAPLRVQADVMLRSVLDALDQVFLRWMWRRLHFDEFVGNPVGGQERLGAYLSTQAWNMATRLGTGRWRLPDQLASLDRQPPEERGASDGCSPSRSSRPDHSDASTDESLGSALVEALLERAASVSESGEDVPGLLRRLAEVGRIVSNDEDPRLVGTWAALEAAVDDKTRTLLDAVTPSVMIDWILRNAR